MKNKQWIKIDWRARYHYNYGPRKQEQKEVFRLLIGSAILSLILALLSIVGFSF